MRRENREEMREEMRDNYIFFRPNALYYTPTDYLYFNNDSQQQSYMVVARWKMPDPGTTNPVYDLLQT
jgi:hypothetical protein